MMHVKDTVNWGPTVQLKRALRCIISANKRPELPTLCCQICWLQPAYFTSVQREVKDVSSGLTPCSLPFIFHLICTTHGCLVSDINTQWKTKLWIPVMYLCSCSHHPLLPRSLRSISYVTLFFLLLVIDLRSAKIGDPAALLCQCILKSTACTYMYIFNFIFDTQPVLLKRVNKKN